MTSSAGRTTEPATRTIAISGSSGLIGAAVVKSLAARGFAIRRLGRGADAGDGVDGATAVLNLAGENVAQRWSTSAKRRIRDSRVDTTGAVARAIIAAKHPPRVFLSGSAIGIYGQRGDEILEESSALGDDFLAGVARDWESAAAPAAERTSIVYLRTGIVLSADGGALAKMLPAFRLGAGGKMGSGNQWMSWISLPDMVRAVEFLLDADGVAGPVNMVAPAPVTNAEFTHTLAHVLHRPSVMTVPAFALSLAMGEMARGTVLASQRVMPRRLAASGFQFVHPTLELAIRAVVLD